MCRNAHHFAQSLGHALKTDQAMFDPIVEFKEDGLEIQ
jgi:hypothetical protein